MMLWSGPNDLETLLTCMIHNYKSYWRTLGPFSYPQGAQKGHFGPKTEANWPKLTYGPYDALEGSKWP